MNVYKKITFLFINKYNNFIVEITVNLQNLIDNQETILS